jgi:autotransporter strand-loop-strand O-heptosyltransferase
MKKIVNVTPGILPIPPNGWGAVEKIIWEFHTNLLALGHDSHITYLDDVPSDADIVHIHVANLALMAHERGIPYYFTCHDHHAFLHGKDSFVYKENLKAMQHAIKSFVPAKYLVDYFDGIPQYFSHGVNTQFFNLASSKPQHKLLCVANNGYISQQSSDRKGFGIAIEAARSLNLPITIAGPLNNKNYFEANPPTYDKLTILYDLNEEELLTLYKNHTIFVHASELEAGHPNLTILEALSCGLPVVGTLEEDNILKGMIRVSRDVVDVTLGIQEVLLQYDHHSLLARHQADKLSWNNRTVELLTLYKGESTSMKDILLKHYNSTTQLNRTLPVKVNYHNVDGLFTELVRGDTSKYDVQFINKKTGEVVFSAELQKNHWAKPNIKYYVDWKIVVRNKTTNEIIEHDLNLEGGLVLVSFESKSLGDTLAWIPYVDEFRKRHNCKVICSTFMNDLFRNVYPDIEFVKPGESIGNLRALYRVGIFYNQNNDIDYNMHPNNPTEIPLQKVCSDILGLPFTEIKPRIEESSIDTPEKTNQVAIAIHSTAQTKYWNNPLGWQTIVNWLTNKGYSVKLLSQEGTTYMGNTAPTGVLHHPSGTIESAIEEIKKSKAFIGISSGLSWLSWTLEVPTVLISGFTDPITEMQGCIRISAPTGKCSGCWSRHKFNPGDWNWCPDHKGTPRQFECSREITADMVIQQLEKIL